MTDSQVLILKWNRLILAWMFAAIISAFFIADVNSAQFEQIKKDPKRLLPPGWAFDKSQNWRRGA